MQEESDFFYVDIFSNTTNRDIVNTTVSFTNTLARPLYLKREDNWELGLHRIICSNKFFVKSATGKEEDALFYVQEEVEKDSELSQVYVKCHQVGQFFDGRKLISCHSRRPFDSETNRVHTYEPKNVLFFPVNSTVINELSISLHTSTLKPLFLRRGQVTAVTLKFQKSAMKENLIPIFISSAGQWSQPGSTASHFTCQIPPMFVNTGQFKWQLGLNSCTYVSDFRLFPKRFTAISDFFIQRNITAENLPVAELSAQGQGDSYKVSIPQADIDSWSTEKHIRSYLKNFILNVVKDYDGRSNDMVKIGNLYKPREEQENPDFKYTRPIYLSFARPCEFFCPTWILSILGFREGQYKTVRNGTMGYFSVSKRQNIFARTLMDAYALVPNSISIYTDVIEQKLMGSVQTSVIKTMPVKHKFGKSRPSTTYEATNIEYYNMATRDLSSMSFRLMDHSGHEIEFQNPNQNVTLSLILKAIT